MRAAVCAVLMGCHAPSPSPTVVAAPLTITADEPECHSEVAVAVTPGACLPVRACPMNSEERCEPAGIVRLHHDEAVAWARQGLLQTASRRRYECALGVTASLGREGDELVPALAAVIRGSGCD